MYAGGVAPSVGLICVFWGSFTVVMFNLFFPQTGANCALTEPSTPEKC